MHLQYIRLESVVGKCAYMWDMYIPCNRKSQLWGLRRLQLPTLLNPSSKPPGPLLTCPSPFAGAAATFVFGAAKGASCQGASSIGRQSVSDFQGDVPEKMWICVVWFFCYLRRSMCLLDFRCTLWGIQRGHWNSPSLMGKPRRATNRVTFHGRVWLPQCM